MPKTPKDYGDETWKDMAITAAVEHDNTLQELESLGEELVELADRWEKAGYEEAAVVELRELLDRFDLRGKA